MIIKAILKVKLLLILVFLNPISFEIVFTRDGETDIVIQIYIDNNQFNCFVGLLLFFLL